MKCNHPESVETRDGKECRQCGIGWKFALKEKKFMKNSKTVYKVVQIYDGKMYSANPNPGHLFDKDNKNVVIEYHMNTLNKANKNQNKTLFFCPTRADARRAKRFYESNKPCKILRGVATNITENSPFRNLYLPSEFKTIFGETFFPTEVIY